MMSWRKLNTAVVSVAMLGVWGCGKSPDAEVGMARTPEQAASQVESAFSNADAKTRELATAMSEALRKNEFENAVVSLQTIRGSEEITPDQRMAIYSSAVTLEARLISAMEGGDKNAERAYQLLKALKKN
jgi:hypothetical protein